MNTRSQHERQQLKDELIATNDRLIAEIPKVELHVHIEGTLTPELRWKLSQRHGVPAPFGAKGRTASSLDELRELYRNVISRAQLDDFTAQGVPEERIPATFFQAYYSGFEVLKTRQDFYDLALAYFERAAAAQVRYCEVFFDPQGHTSRGVSWSDMMDGLKQAQAIAAETLNVHSQWIMCFMRDLSPESAMQHYEAALPYRDMIVGIGLDSKEDDRPPSLFQEVFTRARRDGLKLTAHCDVGVKDTHKHIEQVSLTLGGSPGGGDRIDHGLNAADTPSLLELVRRRGTPLTLCPWAYIRREGYASVAERLRRLLDAGVCFSLAGDSPAYTDDCWIGENMLLARRMAGMTDGEVFKVGEDSVRMCWAGEGVKGRLLEEIGRLREVYEQRR